MSQKYTVTFKIESNSQETAQEIEFYLKDLISSSVLPALNLELFPLTFEVKKARN